MHIYIYIYIYIYVYIEQTITTFLCVCVCICFCICTQPGSMHLKYTQNQYFAGSLLHANKVTDKFEMQSLVYKDARHSLTKKS
jgi:hypothetical protein